jgi:hypothetical protein
MRIRRSHRDAVKCALCPVVTDDLRRGLCFGCYQRQRRHGALSMPAVCVGFDANGCRVSDARLLRPCGNGLRCLNCSMLARLAARAGIVTAA